METTPTKAFTDVYHNCTWGEHWSEQDENRQTRIVQTIDCRQCGRITGWGPTREQAMNEANINHEAAIDELP